MKTEGKGGTLVVDWAGRSADTGVHLCSGSCCNGGDALRAASQEMEGSRRVGGGEDSVGRREAGAGKGG